MTFSESLPIRIVGGVLDFLRYFFLCLAFTGPMLVGLAVKAYTGSDALGVVAAFGAGVTGAAEFTAVGVVLSMAIDVFGLLLIMGWLFLSNRRIFKENPAAIIEIAKGVGISYFWMVSSMYHKQIKAEKKRHKIWQQHQRQLEARARQRATAQIQAQYMLQQQEEQAANDNIPEELEQAA